ncbi:MAG: flagellar hook-basal body complex protein [Oscillospiraceae bacterium]|nr:flagellar hook-basal body complex protein [Oscillospiraceae bacterium]
MMRSLYSGVSGLRSHQTRMDVIGANIANVNTVGFKGSRVTFRDVLYQSIRNAGMSSEEPLRGGINPTQIGLGVMITSIDVLNTRAGPQTTDKPTDIYVDGEGYFAVFNPGDGNIYYTRVGDFSFDPRGNLVDGNGNFVIGYAGGEYMVPFSEFDIPDENMFVEGSVMDEDGEYSDFMADLEEAGDGGGIINIGGEDSLYTRGLVQQISIGPDGMITGVVKEDPEDEEGEQWVLGQILLFKFPNNDGMNQVGNTYLLPTANSGYPAAVLPGTNGTGATIASRLEMSNVELAREFTDMIITQRGFQANSRIITVSDEMLQELVNLKR